MMNVKTYEKKIQRIMEVERCDRAKAERFFELSKMLTSPNFTPEIGKEIYIELEALRTN